MTDKIEIQVEVAAQRAKVFESLTETNVLEQWFAERAFVSEREKRYDFWGRFTPGAPGPEAGEHLLVAFEAPTRLGFRWPLRGANTRVEMTLEEAGGKTIVNLTHEAPLRARTEISLSDFWMLSFENLRRWLRDGSEPVRCDYSTTPHGRLEISVDIQASREDVFRALTHPEELERWIAKKAALEPVAGGRFDFGWEGEGPIKILDIVENEKLSYSWRHGGDPETVVTWTLDGSGGKTRLAIVHSGFGDRDTEDFRTGWLKHMLWMKSILEQGASWKRPELGSTGCDI